MVPSNVHNINKVSGTNHGRVGISRESFQYPLMIYNSIKIPPLMPAAAVLNGKKKIGRQKHRNMVFCKSAFIGVASARFIFNHRPHHATWSLAKGKTSSHFLIHIFTFLWFIHGFCPSDRKPCRDIAATRPDTVTQRYSRAAPPQGS